MNFARAFLIAVIAFFAFASTKILLAQGADEKMLLHPPAGSWPGYHGDYSGRRHSALNQITPQNVKNLALSWAFQTNQSAPIKSSPLLVDGILYFTVPDNIWAVDARSGHAIWHYSKCAGKWTSLMLAKAIGPAWRHSSSATTCSSESLEILIT